MDNPQALVGLARGAAEHAFAPYSHFRVGAALRDAGGATFVGCNVESASYGLTICAERNAIFGAIAAGARRPFSALAVTCPDADQPFTPCGACRQIIVEHLAAEATIHVDRVGTFSPAELLPRAFVLAPVQP